MDGGRVVGVVGARGGVGATTLAAALAVALSRPAARVDGRVGSGGGRPEGRSGAGASDRARSRTALVDLDGSGAGVDVHLGLEAVGGLRWADLADARGDVPGDELAALLPTWSGVTVLSGDRWRPGLPPPDVVVDVLAALAGVHRAVVVDVGRREALDGGPGLARCDTVLLVGGRDLASVAGVVTLRDRVRAVVPDVRLVVGGPAPGGLAALEVAHVVDLPVAGTLPADRRVAAVVERGGGPVAGARGRFARAVARLAGGLA